MKTKNYNQAKLKEKIRRLVNEGISEISEDIKEWNITLEEAKGVSYEVENEVKKIESLKIIKKL